VEIQNTQSGQAFASVTPSSQAEVVRVDKAVSPESDSENGQSFSQEQGTANPSTERLGSNTVSVNQNLSQASRQQADTEVSESSGAQLEEAVAKVESFLKVQNRDLAFTIDEDTKRSVVTVKDSSSGDVIRQIPSEEVLKLAERIQELQQDVGNSVGVFINNQV
jgi:flagellar protein FlaG